MSPMTCPSGPPKAKAKPTAQYMIAAIEKFLKDHNREDDEDSSELKSLSEWLGELKKLKPVEPMEKLRREMARAVEDEKYERAAELRDAIRSLKQKQ